MKFTYFSKYNTHSYRPNPILTHSVSSGLRKKGLLPSHESDSMKLQQDIFGSTDAIVKYVLEGHDRGVNWASFHPTLPLIVSGADDRQIKLWRMSDTKAWEVDTMRGHYNNVSCCIFHPRQDLMLSNGEDKTIRVWDMSKRTLLLTHRRENDRFWALTAHPERNLFAAGHDSGFVVFKLEKERPAMSPGDGGLFYIKDRYIRHYDFGSAKDVPIMSVRKRDFLPRNIQYNKFERAVLVNYDGEGGSYELYQIPKTPTATDGAAEGRRGSGRCAVWIARNRFAVLDKANAILIKDLQNQTSKPLSPPYSIDQLFSAPLGQLLIKADDRMILFDVAQGVEIAECPVPAGIKFVEWFQPSSADPAKAGAGSYVAMMSKDLVVIANHRLEIQCTLAERTRVKSGVWDDTGVFVYTTTSHIKYALPNGDAGIIRTLDQPIYISGVRVAAGADGSSRIYCLDREIRNRSVTVDTTEYQFKQALTAKKYSEVLRMVKGSNLVGQAIIGYLQQKGFPEVALWFVKDERTRFELALESANIKIAEDSAGRLDAPDVWKRLGEEALRQGHVSLLEDSLNHTKDHEKLSFFYAITGNHKKLKQQSQRAQKNKDLNGRYHNALLLGDVAERIAVLEEAGQRTHTV
jgi:coatomer subunit alpha